MTRDRVPVLEGGCQCGAVRYALYQPPDHADICHCRMCQRAVGNLFMAATGGVPLDAFAWTRGEPARYRSSEIAERQFCATCGTPLGFRYLERPSMTVTIGSLDEPARARPTRQLCVEGRLPWLDEALQSPRFTTEEDPPPGGPEAVRSRQAREGA